MRTRILVSLAISGVLFACTLTSSRAADAASNWPQWRGPLGNGVSSTATPPLKWSDTENIKWKATIPGKGLATPIIWDDKVIVQTAVAVKKTAGSDTNTPAANQGGRGMSTPKPTDAYRFVVLCLDRNTGKTLWEQTAIESVPHEGHHRTEGTFASSSAVTDGKNIFAYFGSRGLHCYDMDGKHIWSQQFGQMQIVMSFGEGSSPVLCGDSLIINWDHQGESCIMAIDKKTGATKWKKSRDEKTSWATPVVIEHQGKPQVIVAASNKVRAYDPDSGEVIWECKGLTRNVIPTPVWGNGIVYCMSGYQGTSLLAIRMGGKGDISETDSVVWKYNKGTPYVPSPILAEKRLYFFDNNKEILSCLNAENGQPLFAGVKVPEMEGVYASPVFANGRVYLVGRNGTTVVIKPADTLEVLATNHLNDKLDASPAVVGKELFLRGTETLYCISEK